VTEGTRYEEGNGDDYMKYYSGIFLKEVRKITKNSA